MAKVQPSKKRVRVITNPLPSQEYFFTGKQLNLTDEELTDTKALKEYIDSYYLNETTVASVEVID